jgi:hypothetical protein
MVPREKDYLLQHGPLDHGRFGAVERDADEIALFGNLRLGAGSAHFLGNESIGDRYRLVRRAKDTQDFRFLINTYSLIRSKNPS